MSNICAIFNTNTYIFHINTYDRFSEDVLNPEKVKGTNYDVISKLQQKDDNSDVISSEKFVAVLKEGLKSWPRFDENEDYWKK